MATGIPGEEIIAAWAGAAGVDIGAAMRQARQMYAADPGALGAGGDTAAGVGDGLDNNQQDLRGVAADARQNWAGDSAVSFGRAHGLTAQQVGSARESSAALSTLLRQVAQSAANAQRGVAMASSATAARLGILGQEATPTALIQARQAIQAWVQAIAGLFAQARGAGPTAAGGPGAGGAGGGGAGGGGAGGGGMGTGAAGAFTPPPPGTVNDWIEQARQALIASGVPPDQIDAGAIYAIIMRESGGDPNAINNWDSNAAAGTPSQGIMQTIPSTFNSFKLPGHDNITNPVDNIIAASRYAIDRYGSLSAVASRPGGY